MPKVNHQKGLFARLDDRDLLCEISIFSSCSLIGLCQPCRKHLTWCLEILQQRWNYIEYIDFYSALEVIKNNRKLFNDSVKFCFWRENYIRKLISKE